MRVVPKIAYYGDDFTGATDTLATAARAGLRSLLFLGLPTAEQLGRAGPLDCLGIAGAARAMSPAEMHAELEPVGRLFATLGAPLIHYKTCSTFDSAPQVGSIGAAIGVLRAHAGNPLVAIVGGQPNLRRYCLFGNLFASAGADMFRIDRHPTMSRHPVTPMGEADLRRHLRAQGLERVVGIDHPAYADSEDAQDARLAALLAERPDAVLFDVSRDDDLRAIGRQLWSAAQSERLLAAGPSSVVQALAAHWGCAEQSPPPVAAAEGPVLLLAGSLSPMTARQIEAASSYERVPINPARLAADAGYVADMARAIAGRLAAGRHVLAATSAGGAREAGADGRALAIACGALLAAVLQCQPLKRLGIAGGDTSSHAVQALAAWGLSYQAQLAPGVALCRLHSDEATLDGLEIMLKGGQMGGPTLFEQLIAGNAG